MEIVEYIEEKLTGRLPELRNTIVPVKQEDRYIPDFSIRQTVEIGQKDFPKVFQMLPESLKRKAKKIRPEHIEITGGYDSTEYYGKYDILSSSPEDAARLFFKKADKLNLSVYNADKAKNLPAFIEATVETELPEYNIVLPETCKLTETEKSYNIIDGNIYCLTLNLPYEYYKDIDLPDFTACYDLDSKEFWFTGGDIKEHQETLNSVAENGFLKHIMLKIDGGVIVSAKDYYWAILIAKELKLPTIPVCLYVTEEETSCFEKCIDKNIADKKLINKLCAPYFSF